MSGRDVLVELHWHHTRDTEASYCVSETGDSDDAIYLPKSECARLVARRPSGGYAAPVCVYRVPEWLARRHELDYEEDDE